LVSVLVKKKDLKMKEALSIKNQTNQLSHNEKDGKDSRFPIIYTNSKMNWLPTDNQFF